MAEESCSGVYDDETRFILEAQVHGATTLIELKQAILDLLRELPTYPG